MDCAKQPGNAARDGGNPTTQDLETLVLKPTVASKEITSGSQRTAWDKHGQAAKKKDGIIDEPEPPEKTQTSHKSRTFPASSPSGCELFKARYSDVIF